MFQRVIKMPDIVFMFPMADHEYVFVFGDDNIFDAVDNHFLVAGDINDAPFGIRE